MMHCPGDAERRLDAVRALLAVTGAPDIGGFITRHMTRRERFWGLIPGSRVHAELP
jgi:hypothetical protein